MLIFPSRYFLFSTFVCPTELIAFSDNIDEFTARNAAVIGCSVDSVHAHLKWNETERNMGGIKGLRFPLLWDKLGNIARSYGVMDEEKGVATR